MARLMLLFAGALAIFSISDAYPASSRQLLPHIPGYVPVYIRNGDTPLEDINLDLAEAFHAIPSGRSASRNNIKALRSNDPEENDTVSKAKSASVQDDVSDVSVLEKKDEFEKHDEQVLKESVEKLKSDILTVETNQEQPNEISKIDDSPSEIETEPAEFGSKIQNKN